MRDYKEYDLLTAKGANGVGNIIDVSDFRNAVISVATDGGADAALTVKFAGAISDDSPTFTSAQSVTNMFDYIQVIDLEDGSSVDGDVGFSVATADDYKQYEVNINALKWFAAVVSGRTEGEVTVKMKVFTNN